MLHVLEFPQIIGIYFSYFFLKILTPYFLYLKADKWNMQILLSKYKNVESVCFCKNGHNFRGAYILIKRYMLCL